MHRQDGWTRRRLFKGIGGALLGGVALQVIGARTARAHLEADIDQTINVIMGDSVEGKPTFFFEIEGKVNEAAKFAVKIGQTIRFVFQNQGKVLHDAHFGRDPDLAGRFFMKNLVAPFDMLELDSGQTGKITFSFTQDHVGDWEIGCFQPAHYETGMKVPFTVQP